MYSPFCLWELFKLQWVGRGLALFHHHISILHGRPQGRPMQHHVHKGVGRKLVQEHGIAIHDAGTARHPQQQPAAPGTLGVQLFTWLESSHTQTHILTQSFDQRVWKSCKSTWHAIYPNQLDDGHLEFSICMKLKGFCGIRVTAVRVPIKKRQGRRKPIKIAASAMEPLWKRNNTPRTFARIRLVLVVEPPQRSIYLYIISTGVNHPKSRTKLKFWKNWMREYQSIFSRSGHQRITWWGGKMFKGGSHLEIQTLLNMYFMTEIRRESNLHTSEDSRRLQLVFCIHVPQHCEGNNSQFPEGVDDIPTPEHKNAVPRQNINERFLP